MHAWRGTSSCFAWAGESGPSGTNVVFRGDLDLLAVGGAREGLAEALGAAGGVVTFDLGELTFMDSSGLRFIIDAKRALDARKVPLMLRNVPAAITRILDVTSLTSFFEIEPPPKAGVTASHGGVAPGT